MEVPSKLDEKKFLKKKISLDIKLFLRYFLSFPLIAVYDKNKIVGTKYQYIFSLLTNSIYKYNQFHFYLCYTEYLSTLYFISINHYL